MPHQFNHIDRGLCNQSDSSMMICIMPDSLLCEGFGMPINGKWCAVPWKMTVIHFPPIGKRSPWQTNKLEPKPNFIWHISHFAAILQILKVFIWAETFFFFFLNVEILISFRIYLFVYLFFRKAFECMDVLVFTLNVIITSNTAIVLSSSVDNVLMILMTACDNMVFSSILL